MNELNDLLKARGYTIVSMRYLYLLKPLWELHDKIHGKSEEIFYDDKGKIINRKSFGCPCPEKEWCDLVRTLWHLQDILSDIK